MIAVFAGAILCATFIPTKEERWKEKTKNESNSYNQYSNQQLIEEEIRQELLRQKYEDIDIAY